MISRTLKKIVEEELHGADIATKIKRVSTSRRDEAMLQRYLKLPVKEIWKKRFPRTNEEIERYNANQQALANRGNSYHYEYGGENIVELAIVPYEDSIPNAFIDVPRDIFSRCSAGEQEQVIFGEGGIVFREVRDSRPTYGIVGSNRTVLGEIGPNTGRHRIAKPYEAILKSTIKALLAEPNDFLHSQYSPENRSDDHLFSVLTLVPKSHLSLENWWQKNQWDFRNSHYPKMSQWKDTPLIYATILRPELERQGYVLDER